MTVTIYVEGGGVGKDLRPRCREAFSKLLARAGFEGRMPRVIPGGSRSDTFDDFRRALRAGSEARWPVLLVDSEERVSGAAWEHLTQRDGWARPEGVTDDQAQLMVTCMETWIIADRGALKAVFGSDLHVTALLPSEDLETRTRGDVQRALEKATAPCGERKAYRKGRRSFQVLAEVDPAELAPVLPHFKRLIDCLNRRLPQASSRQRA